jgi:hypothetical protein
MTPRNVEKKTWERKIEGGKTVAHKQWRCKSHGFHPPQRREERRRDAESFPEGSFLSLLLCEVSAFSASLR